MDDIEEIIAEAKRKRQRGETVDAMENLADEGVLPGTGTSEKREVTAYERAAETIIGGMHKVDEAKSVLQHANIPAKVVAPVLEIIITTEAMITELAKMAGVKIQGDKVTIEANYKNTIDDLTMEENIILVQEAIRITEAIPLILTAKDGFRSIQAVQVLNAVVNGQAMLQAGELGLFNGSQGNRAMNAIRGLLGKSKK